MNKPKPISTPVARTVAVAVLETEPMTTQNLISNSLVDFSVVPAFEPKPTGNMLSTLDKQFKNLLVHGTFVESTVPSRDGGTRVILTWHPLGTDGQPRPWSVTSLTVKQSSYAVLYGLNAMNDYLAGEISGNERIIFTAPLETLANRPDARGGFVRGDYEKDFTYVDASGKQRLVNVPDDCLPSVRDADHFRGLNMHEGRFVRVSHELDLVFDAENNGGYWRARVLSYILRGECVCFVGYSEKILFEFSKIVSMFSAETQEQFSNAESHRRQDGRQGAAIQRAVNGAVDIDAIRRESGLPTQQITAQGLQCLTTQGTLIDITVFLEGGTIPYLRADGKKDMLRIRNRSLVAVQAAANILRELGALVLING